MTARRVLAALATAALCLTGITAAHRNATAADPRWFGDGASWDQSEVSRTELVIGDSLAGQFSGPLTALAAQRAQHWEVWAISGSAPCDALPTYGDHILAMSPLPSRIGIAYVGNVGNMHNGVDDCMVSRLWPGMDRSPATLSTADRARIANLYRGDIAQMIQWNLAHNMQTILIDPPVMQSGTYFHQVNANLVDSYDTLAAQYGGVGSTHLVRDTVSPGEAFRQSLTEPDGNVFAVRATDGTHLAAPYGTQLYAAAAFAALTVP